jgi:hypothetical protein
MTGQPPTADAALTIAVRCECGRAYYDASYCGEPCRECGAVL